MTPIATKLKKRLRATEIIAHADEAELRRRVAHYEDPAFETSIADGELTTQRDHQLYAHLLNILGNFNAEVLATRGLSAPESAVELILDEYLPGYPPMSPVTISFCNYFMCLDHKLNQQGDTVYSLFCELRPKLVDHPVVGPALDNLGDSRMGMYEIVAVAGAGFTCEELVSNERFDAICSSGHQAKVGELWFCRFAAPIAGDEDTHVALITPYVLTGHTRGEFESFIYRQITPMQALNLEHKLNALFRRHEPLNYWFEYILLAYSTHSNHHIELQGLPDVEGTKPHE